MKKIASFALGCKVNQYESEAIAELFKEKGYEIVDISEKADIYIINTCTVTNLGDKKSRQLLRRCKRQNPDALVAAIGCYAQTAGDELMKIPEVDLILGTKDRHKLIDLVEKYYGTGERINAVSEIKGEKVFEPLSIKTLKNRTRAYLKIEDGCNMFCSYCIIPYARGTVRSRNVSDVLDEVKALCLNGFKEVVLTGIHVASYGKDLKDTSLLDIIKLVHDIPGLERIRLSSLEPMAVTEEFAREVSLLPKMCRHFHLSLQSGCDKTLKAMNRRYSTEEYFKAAERIRKYMPDAALTTDIIVGFPGETEEDFEKSMGFAEKVGFAAMHVFPYSPKKGTPAAKMPDQLKNSEKAERAHKMGLLSKKLNESFLKSRIGSTSKVLFEQQTEDGFFFGHTSDYIKVYVKSDEDLSNKIADVKLMSVFEDGLLGSFVN